MVVARRDFYGSVLIGGNNSGPRTQWSELTSDVSNGKDTYEQTGEEFVIYYRQAVLKFIASLPRYAVVSILECPENAQTTVYYYKQQPAHTEMLDTMLAPGAELVNTLHYGSTSPGLQAQAGPVSP